MGDRKYCGGFFIVQKVLMFIYAFDDSYSKDEVNNYDFKTCKALAKHDPEHVKCFEFFDKKLNNVSKVINEGHYSYIQIYETEVELK